MHPFPFIVIQRLAGDPTIGARATDPTVPSAAERRAERRARRRAWRLRWRLDRPRTADRDVAGVRRQPSATAGQDRETQRQGWAHSRG